VGESDQHGRKRERVIRRVWSASARLGAAHLAPTAPHATWPAAALDAPVAKATRFWSPAFARRCFVATCILSAVVHAAVSPWRLLPRAESVDLKDVEGELTIPVELFAQSFEPPPAPAAEAPPNASARAGGEGDLGAPVSPPAKKPEKKPKREQPARTAADAGVEGARELSADAPDAGAPDGTDAALHAARELENAVHGDAGLAMTDNANANADAGGERDDKKSGLGAAGAGEVAARGPAAAPRDPGEMIGMPGLISAGAVNVMLLVNVAEIRRNPVGARIGPLLSGIAQWADFLKTSHASIDPVRDTDWIMIYGPSLIHTERDAIFVRYTTTDSAVDSAMAELAKRYPKGGAFDTRVAGVKAWLGHADNAERVFLRGQSRLAVIVPKDHATPFAKLAKAAVVAPRVRAGEAMRLTLHNPSKQIAIRGLAFADSVQTLRLWIEPHANDGGADVWVEGDCTDALAAEQTAAELTALVARQNSILVRAATRGLLNRVAVRAEGTRFSSKIAANQEQLEAVLQAVAALLGVQIDMPSGGVSDTPVTPPAR